MDLSFRFDRMRADALPASPDVGVLLAGLAAEQARTPTAMTAARSCAGVHDAINVRGALVLLFTGGEDWMRAGQALAGSFHPRIAGAAAGKAGSTLMKPGFTFAF